MGISMIVFSLILLMFFAYRGYSIIFIAPILPSSPPSAAATLPCRSTVRSI